MERPFDICKGDYFMKHDCRELLEYKKPTYGSLDEYEECINRKARVLADSAVGTGMTLKEFFLAMDTLGEVAEKAKEFMTEQVVL
jgi:hypothetical protein|nr:MAG TPA: hypothetical protein [Caudoviricetes sp.]